MLTDPGMIRNFIQRWYAKTVALRPVNFIEHAFWKLAIEAPFGATVIPTNDDDDDPYLMRTYLTPAREAVRKWLSQVAEKPEEEFQWVMKLLRPYLHYFFRGDDDREYHNHPWRGSLSIILLGGYVEYRIDPKTNKITKRRLRPGMVNYIARDTYHRVELLPEKGCWTLFITWGRVQESDGRDWFFYNPETGEFIPWGIWVRDHQGKKSRDARLGRPGIRVA